MIQPRQKLREGDYCNDLTKEEWNELYEIEGGRKSPYGKNILFTNLFGAGLICLSNIPGKAKTEYNFADFKQLCENTFRDGN